MKFLLNFPGGVFQTFKDKPEAKGYAEVILEYNEEYLRKVNSLGCGVYFTPNAFKGGRKKELLTKINAIYADLDLGKEGQGEVTMLERAGLSNEVRRKFEPNFIIVTKNGIQPIWLLDEDKTDEETQELFTNVANGIIEWSKTVGAMGDQVKDTTRVLRLPNFYHMKGDPYLCKAYEYHEKKTTLKEMAKVFPYEVKKVEYKQTTGNDFANNPVSMAIERLDFQDVIIRAFNSVGRSASFDNQKRLTLDNRLTGTHQGKTGDCRFLASNSHEPFTGPLIKAVGDILNTTPTEGRKWIVETYNLDLSELKKKKKTADGIKKVMEKKIIKKKKFAWGTKAMNESFGIIKPASYIVVGAGPGTGKTTYCLNMAFENIKLGNKVLYLSLEMDNEEILDYLARKYAGWTVEEEYNETVPDYKREAYEKRRSELESMELLNLKGVVGGTDVNWDMLKELMKGDYDMVIVDNFNCIEKEEGDSVYDHQGRLSKRFLGYTNDNQVPIVVVHHFSQGGAQSQVKTSHSLAGNTKIANDAHRVVLLERKTKAKDKGFSSFEDAVDFTDKEKATMLVKLDKGRGYDDGIYKIIYFKKGTFHDQFDEAVDVKW